MHDPHKQRPPTQEAVVRPFSVPLISKVKVDMPFSSVGVRMDVPAHESHSKEDDHQGNREFKNVGHAFGNSEAENQDDEACNEHGCCVSRAPENTDLRRL